MSDKPIQARAKARSYFENWKGLMNESIKPGFKSSSTLEIDSEKIELNVNHGIGVYIIIDDDEYNIDFYGAMSPEDFDFIVNGLDAELEYYKENNLETDDIFKVTYCDVAEFTEGYEDTAIETFELMHSSVDLTDKDKPYWWLDKKGKVKLIKEYIDKRLSSNLEEKGENYFREFKPALLYNFKTEKPSMHVKYKNAQAICAFLNTNVGRLYIGVNDDGIAQGLENSDFKIADFNRKDPYDYVRLQFDSLMSFYFSKDINHYVKADFELIQGKQVFVVTVKPSNRPVFLKNKKDHNIEKEFYIRTSASSKRITDPEELVNYCFSHWTSL